MSVSTKFLSSLLTTYLVEIPLLILFIKFIFKTKEISMFRLTMIGIIASGLTLPYLWFLFPYLINGRNMILWGELFAVLVETIVYKTTIQISTKKSFTLSSVLNIASFFLGKIIVDFLLRIY